MASKRPKVPEHYLSTAAWAESQLDILKKQTRKAQVKMDEEHLHKMHEIKFELDNKDMREDSSLWEDLGTVLIVLGIIGILYALFGSPV